MDWDDPLPWFLLLTLCALATRSIITDRRLRVQVDALAAKLATIEQRLPGPDERLAPGGRGFVSNIAEGNPFRPWIEYLADWWLIERTEVGVVRLLEEAGFDPRRVRISRDSTGLALMAEATA